MNIKVVTPGLVVIREGTRLHYCRAVLMLSNEFNTVLFFLGGGVFLLFYYFFLLASWVVSANGPGDLGSIPGRVIPKTLKMVLDTSLIITQQYKVHIKGKVEQSRERSSALRYTSV